MPDAPGRADVIRLCSDCHSLEVVTLRRYNPRGWEEVLEEMSRQGTVFTDENYDAVLRYLSVHFGRVNVNEADADSLALVLELTPEQAQRIVGHRSKVKAFETLPELIDVLAVDPAFIQDRKARVLFK
jgi:DNA uptake protein ComE-like DNA-binding protein